MKRRHSHTVRVGNVPIGSDHPVVVQSMTTTPTLDIEASARQAQALATAGAQMVRLTAQGVQHASSLAKIRALLDGRGIDVPLVADIHFNPAAAFEAARHVEKVRINPGNFADPGRTFRKLTFTDSEYAAELARLREKVVPFFRLCAERGTAVRIGVNHGSLSDRVMSRFGDGPAGMVESAMEFLRIAAEMDFSDIVVSIKASDVPTMTATVRALVRAMDTEGMDFPLHLGVTEAGNALEGRIKSAIGIGSLLTDGIGDTIRVSLSEDPCAEIPVAKALIAHVEANESAQAMHEPMREPAKRPKEPVVAESEADISGLPLLKAAGGNRIAAVRNAAPAEGLYAVALSYTGLAQEDAVLAAAVDLGYLLLEGRIGALCLHIEGMEPQRSAEIARMIVQGAGLGRYKAEIVACPGCGRTLFDLPTALEKVKHACGHLRHLKIAVMGCIVNGPGEMAGADYGYVGAAAGNVSIYRGIEPVWRNIPQEKAISRLIELIKADGEWADPA